MELCEEIFQTLSNQLFNSPVVLYENNEIDFTPPYERISYSKLFFDYVGIDITSDFETLKQFAVSNGINVELISTKEMLIDEIFKKNIRPKLIAPLFIYDYPKTMFPLAKLKSDDQNLAEVFQFYAGGLELVKAFTELNDSNDQRARFQAQEDNRAKGDEEAQRMDEDFLQAMEFGMPPNSGVGLGMDRLVALMTDSHSIREIILFPFMKPKEEVKEYNFNANDNLLAVAIINKGVDMEWWQKMNIIAHLNAAFGARIGEELFFQNTIKTKDGKHINLNIQHAIMIKSADTNDEIRDVITDARQKGLNVSEFTREMLGTTDDRKIIAITKDKDFKDIEYLGALVFGKKSEVEEITNDLPLFK